ncbi:MAG: GNAT family N-acetyltransferase [Firmicutes bacterium]|nr:GNAT family N-acetyltransferase [Bacillota bacterium]
MVIYELDKKDFFKVGHLLKGDLVNIEIKGVVQGFNQGSVFVDNLKKPKTAMVWSKAIDGFYFIGDENNKDFNDYINNYIDIEINQRAKALGLDSFEFSGTSLKWDLTFKSIFKNRKLSKSKQLTYKYKDIIDVHFKDIKLEKQFKILKVNKSLFKKEISNLDFVKSMILDWWESLEDLFDYGVGFCIIHNKKIVSCCISSCVTLDSMGSHTITLKDFRKKGLARKLITRYLKYCKDNNFEPNWDCMETNLSSRYLAESCGYKKEFDYNLYEFKFRD